MFRVSVCLSVLLSQLSPTPAALQSVGTVALDLTDIPNPWCTSEFCENRGCTKMWPSRAVRDRALPGEEGEEQPQVDNMYVPEEFSEMRFSDQSPPLDVNNLPGVSVA